MIRRFSLYGFLKNQQYYDPFLILAFREKGLSFLSIGLLIAFREVMINVFEVPSGAVADTWGRRRSMIFSFCAYIVSFVLFGAAAGVPLDRPAPLFAATVLLSNLVSNVPAVMLLLPMAGGAADPAGVGLVLALVSTLAGNLLIVGSIANIIVVDAARREGIAIDWKRHARAGVPVTLATLTIAAAWLAWRA